MGGFTAKPISTTTGDNCGMGLLLVFFPEDNNSSSNSIVNKTNKLFSPTSSPSSSFKRSNSNNSLMSKAQSTISICAILVFITLLLFTLSTFEPTTSKSHPFSAASRRFLSSQNLNPSNNNANNHSVLLSSSSWFGKMWKQKSNRSREQFALQRMGTLYRRGTRAMTDLVVGHVDVDVTVPEFRLFLRLLLRSGLTVRADIVFMFASSTSSKFRSAILEENELFLNLVRSYGESNYPRGGADSSKNFSTTATSQTKHKPSSSSSSSYGFDVGQFLKTGKNKETEEPIWGKKSTIRTNSSVDETDRTELIQFGSVVGFEVGELDPENSLSGFLEHSAPMSLRRWACYPMLFGRLRRSFKHIMLVDVKNSVVLGDPLGRVRHKTPESVLLSTVPNKHCNKNSDPTQSHCPVDTAVIAGGARGIRRMSNTVLTEIVRVAMQQQQRKRKAPVTESVILSQLVGNKFISKNINLVTLSESIPDASSVAHSGLLSSHAVIQRGNSNHHELNSIIMKQICSSEIDSSVYRDYC